MSSLFRDIPSLSCLLSGRLQKDLHRTFWSTVPFPSGDRRTPKTEEPGTLCSPEKMELFSKTLKRHFTLHSSHRWFLQEFDLILIWLEFGLIWFILSIINLKASRYTLSCVKWGTPAITPKKFRFQFLENCIGKSTFQRREKTHRNT